MTTGVVHRSRSATVGLLVVLIAAAAGAGVLQPEWSRPLPAPVLAAAPLRKPGGADELFLLLADRTILALSQTDTVRLWGRAPEGSTALVGIPWDSLHSPMLVLAAGKELIGLDREMRLRWQRDIGSAVDSLVFVDRTVRGGLRLLAWRAGRPLVLTIDVSGVAQRLVATEFVPADALLADLDLDGTPELVASDGAHVFAGKLDGSWEIRLGFPASPAAPPHRQARVKSRIISCGDVDRDSAVEIVCLTGRRTAQDQTGAATYDSLRCLDAHSGREEWRISCPDTGAGFTTVEMAGTSIIYASCRQDGAGRLGLLDETGTERYVYQRPRGDRMHPHSASLYGSWVLSLWVAANGSDVMLLLPPTLASGPETPGYGAVRLLRVMSWHLNRDTFPDLAVARTSVDAGMRLDAFSNGVPAIIREHAAAITEVRRATSRGNPEAVLRALRRARLLERQFDRGITLTRRELSELRRAQVRARNEQRLLVGLTTVLGVLLAAILVLRRRRTLRERQAPRAQQIENKPLSVRVALAGALVAVDHNFVSKGNRPAAVARLKELREQLGLAGDIDLGKIEDEVEPHYSRSIGRLIDQNHTEPVLATLERAARAAARGAPLEVVEVSREGLRRMARAEGLKIISVRNFEYPDVYQHLRWLMDTQKRSLVEHLVVDHFRYRRQWAWITLDYMVNTHWNRKLVIQLLSDSTGTIDLSRKHGHLASELAELSAGLGQCFEIPEPVGQPSDPDEKLWIRVADFISVLDETRRRLQGTGGE